MVENFSARWPIWMICIGIAGCTTLCGKSHEDLEPEDVVEAYLEVALNMTSTDQRGDLIQYATGELYDSIAGASDETIKEAYVDKRYELLSYSVVERRDRTPRETEVTFIIKYRNHENTGNNDPFKGESVPEVEVENTVAVIKDRKLWKIREVLNKKSTFDFPVAVDEIKGDTKNPTPYDSSWDEEQPDVE